MHAAMNVRVRSQRREGEREREAHRSAFGPQVIDCGVDVSRTVISLLFYA